MKTVEVLCQKLENSAKYFGDSSNYIFASKEFHKVQDRSVPILFLKKVQEMIAHSLDAFIFKYTVESNTNTLHILISNEKPFWLSVPNEQHSSVFVHLQILNNF